MDACTRSLLTTPRTTVRRVTGGTLHLYAEETDPCTEPLCSSPKLHGNQTIRRQPERYFSYRVKTQSYGMFKTDNKAMHWTLVMISCYNLWKISITEGQNSCDHGLYLEIFQATHKSRLMNGNSNFHYQSYRIFYGSILIALMVSLNILYWSVKKKPGAWKGLITLEEHFFYS